MVVRFSTTYTISAYHHCSCELESRPNTKICDNVCGQWLSPGIPVSFTNKTNRCVIAEILALTTITPNPNR